MKWRLLASLALLSATAYGGDLKINACWPASTTVACLLPIAGTSGGTGVSSTATFPTSGVVVTEAATETLTNKTLNGNTATNLISGSGTLTLNTTGTITVPNATDTLSTLTGTETLTNKTVGLANGTVGAPSLNFTADADGTGTGIYRIGANNLGFSANGVATGNISAAGAWTIGNSGVDATAIITGSTTTHLIVNINNADSTTSSDQVEGLGITKGSATTTTAQRFVHFYISNQGADSGRITANGVNAAAFGSTSDARIKEHIVDLPSQLGKIMALRPVEFDYRKGIPHIASGHSTGFIAQEMDKVYPDAVDKTDTWLSITGWDKTDARLVKAMQEINAKLDKVTADFDAYKKAHP